MSTKLDFVVSETVIDNLQSMNLTTAMKEIKEFLSREHTYYVRVSDSPFVSDKVAVKVMFDEDDITFDTGWEDYTICVHARKTIQRSREMLELADRLEKEAIDKRKKEQEDRDRIMFKKLSKKYGINNPLSEAGVV